MRTSTRTRADRRRSVVIREHGSRSACYVTTFQGPRSVWNTWWRDGYPPASEHRSELVEAIRARGIRWGAYGDPGAVPTDLVRRWSRFGRWTGYTHAWRRRPSLRPWLMASVDSEAEALEASSRGWRTFRVEHDRTRELEPLEGELVCPASDEAGKRTTCDRCGLCNGHGGSVAHSPASYRASVQGLELWRGPSRFDGSPVGVVVTGLREPSGNGKTGPLLQAWILAENEAPHDAQRSGHDASVCGSCPLRPLLARAAGGVA